MRNKLLRRIRADGLLAPGDVVYCALSGGTDSVALTHLLCALAEELEISVRVCHFNHRLRGADSDADEAFCRDFAVRLGVPIEVGSADVAAWAKAHGQSVEEAARCCRYAFFETLDGKREHVELVFSSFRRRLKTALLAVIALFLPVIIALFLNGFDFARLELGGSAAWFCIMVPVVPVYLLKFAVVELYERPWIYLISEDGRKKRYRPKKERKDTGRIVKTVLRVLFVPPKSFAVWFGILAFCIMCYLTAFGFD